MCTAFHVKMSNKTTNTQSINNNEVCDSESDRQYVDEIEEQCGLRQLQQEVSIGEQQFEGKALPTLIISLAQKLMPLAVQRLNRHDDLRREQVWDNTNDDFTGMCAPLGNCSEVVSPTSTEITNANNNLKTTGLEDELRYNSMQQHQTYPIHHQSDLEMGDPTEYLPESAALLISALNHGSHEKPRKHNSDGSNHLPPLLDGVLNDESETDGEHRSFDNFEQEAEALLRYIRDETKKEVTSPHACNNSDVAPSLDDGDDDSIGGDMVRLTNAIAYLQQDLQNVDMSHLDDLYDDQFNGFGGEGTAWWSRMKLWFSRGMIMEQKLLHSVGMGNDDHASGVDTTTRDRYVDNPVLIWSLAIMWAFVLLIMGHSHIAEWVEGEDPGRLADIIEWLFM